MERKPGSTTNKYFRPGIVIFADEFGTTIYNLLHSSGLLGHIDEPLRDGIGFIYPARSGTGTDETAAPYYCRLTSSPESQQEGKETFAEALKQMWNSIDCREAQNQYYIVENTLPQLYVVAHANQNATSQVIDEIRRGEFGYADISCILCCDPSDPTDSNITQLSAWARQQGVHFCYLYGNVPQITYDSVGKATFDYAAAEALFCLLATGITAHEQFRLPTRPDATHCGTLSTTLILIPRDSILNACSAQVAALLIAGWLHDAEQMRTKTPEVTAEATAIVSKIKQQIGRDDTLVSQPQYGMIDKMSAYISNKWHRQHAILAVPVAQTFSPHYEGLLPNHEAEKAEIENLLLIKETEALFQDSVFDSTIPRDQWIETMRERFEDAQSTKQSTWQEALTRVWHKHQELIRKELANLIMQQQGERDAAWIIAFCDEINTQLQTLHDELDAQLQALYDKILQNYKKLNSNEQRQHTDQIAQNDTQKGEDKRQEQVLSGQSVQDTLYNQVNKRLATVYNQIDEQLATAPSLRPFLLVGLITVLACSLPLFMLAVLLLGHRLWYLPTILLVMALIVAAVYRLDWRRRLLFLRQRQEELLRTQQEKCMFSCVSAAYEQRHRFIKALQDRISYLTTTYLSEVQKTLEDRTHTYFEDLFKSEVGRRDFFYGNGMYLDNADIARKAYLPVNTVAGSQQRSYPSPAERLYTDIAEDSQNTLLRVCKGRLLSWFEYSGDPVAPVPLDKTLEDAMRQTIQLQYMPKLNLEMNLEKRDTWERIYQRLSEGSLSHFQTENTPMTIFLCTASAYAREARKGMNAALLNNIVEVRITPHWLLAAALYLPSLALQESDEMHKVESER